MRIFYGVTSGERIDCAWVHKCQWVQVSVMRVFVFVFVFVGRCVRGDSCSGVRSRGLGLLLRFHEQILRSRTFG